MDYNKDIYGKYGERDRYSQKMISIRLPEWKKDKLFEYLNERDTSLQVFLENYIDKTLEFKDVYESGSL